MKVLITGANGMVAHAATAHCNALGDETVSLTREQLDIGDADNVGAVIGDGGFDAILNCAAYTDVDGAESHEEVSYRANAIGVENLAVAARAAGATFVTISTDYVFDGAKDGFYTQDDDPRPQGVYARSKLDGERRAIVANPDAIIVRSGWIFGSGGTNFLSVMPRLLAEGKTLRAIGDSYGTPTYAVDLAGRMRELAELRRGDIFHVVNSGEGTSYLGFAEAICEIGGFDRGLLEHVLHKELKRPAPRPANSRLKCLVSERYGLSPMPDWQDAVTRYLNVAT